MLKGIVGGQFNNLGYDEEISYWRHLGGTGSTCNDCMVSYLTSQGYSGTPRDQLNAWLQAQNPRGHPDDSARALVGYK